VRSARSATGGVMPGGLAYLSLSALGLLKSTPFKGGVDVRADERASALASVRLMGCDELDTFVRPRMLPVHSLVGNVGLADPAAGGFVELPAEVQLSIAHCYSEGVFLVDNGRVFLLRIGRNVDPAWLYDVFGVQSLDGVDVHRLRIRTPLADEAASQCRRLTNIIAFLRSLTPSVFQKLFIMREADVSEAAFFSALIEDRDRNNEPSIAEFEFMLQSGGGDVARVR
jgi:protein transport protein SEC24